MLSKVLLIAAVMVLAYLLLGQRAGRVREVRRAERDPRAGAPGGGIRVVAYSLLAVMVAGSALVLYLRAHARDQVVTVRVINSDTGRSTRYRAHLGDVGKRSFETLDGRRVVLAEVERMELVPSDAVSPHPASRR
jgi:hypothetical protein